MKGSIMIISRKVLLLATMSLGCALINAKGDTYITNQALPYDVMTPKADIILKFAQEICPPFSYSTTHKAIAEWLTKGIANYLFDNITIITIANIIESDATLGTKIGTLSAIQAEWTMQHTQSQRNNSIMTGIFFAIFAAMVARIVYDITTTNKILTS